MQIFKQKNEIPRGFICQNTQFPRDFICQNTQFPSDFNHRNLYHSPQKTGEVLRLPLNLHRVRLEDYFLTVIFLTEILFPWKIKPAPQSI